jgi:hypothetical protein
VAVPAIRSLLHIVCVSAIVLRYLAALEQVVLGHCPGKARSAGSGEGEGGLTAAKCVSELMSSETWKTRVHVSFGVNCTENLRKSITRPGSEWFDANSRVCSAHFEGADFQTQSCRSREGDSLAAVMVVELEAPLCQPALRSMQSAGCPTTEQTKIVCPIALKSS